MENRKQLLERIPSNILEQIPFNIRKARKESHLSQYDLGVRIGYSTTTISKIESGKRKLGIDEVVLLSQILDKPLNTFFEGSTQYDSTLGSIIELKKVERIAIPVWNKIGLNTEGIIVCYSYFDPDQIIGRNIVGLWFHGKPFNDEIKNGDIIFIDTQSKLEQGTLVLAIMNDIPVIMRVIKDNYDIVFQYSDGILSSNMVDVKGFIFEIRRKYV